MSTTSSISAIDRSDQPSKLQPRPTSAKTRVIKLARQIHLYIGLFSAPALLFFAFSGALQTFSLHKAKKGSDYKPANWIAMLAEVHKNQTAQLPVHKPKSSSRAATAAKPVEALASAPALPVHHRLPLKIFFVIASLSFFSSVLTGITMSYKHHRNKTLVTGVLVTGLVIPIFLLFI